MNLPRPFTLSQETTMFKVGEEVGIIKLKNAYDGYVLHVLGGRLERLDQERTGKRRPAAKYKVKAAMPDADEYARLKHQKFTTDVDAACDEAASEIESLAGEMRDWYDNMGENLQQSDKGSRLEEAADALESIEVPDRPEVAGHISFVHLPSLDASSRGKRASEAADQLRSSAEAVRDFIGENQPEEGENTDETTMTFTENDEKVEVKVDWSELESFADDCETAADDLEAVEFPGMYD